jgi:hypothetical protein
VPHPFTAKLTVELCGPSLKTIETIISLAGIPEPIGLAAQEVPSTIGQVKLSGLAIRLRALKPPAPTSIGRHRTNQPNAVAHNTFTLARISRLVRQFNERVRRIGRVDLDLDGKLPLAEMERPGRTLSHLQPRACERTCCDDV